MENKEDNGYPIRIAIDAMGGDFAPEEIVRGARDAARLDSYRELILVGQEDLLKTRFPKELSLPNLAVLDASEVIQMSEHPATAVKNKPNSSIAISAKLIRNGDADAFVSAGNTGAVMAACLLYLGRIKGVPRPAIFTLIPSLKQPVLLADAGANSECRPEHLLEFAIIGATYAQKVLNRVDPRIGLVSIGEEESKGNELTKAAYELLRTAPLNFIGNIESRDIPYGNVDVAICDGFTGNVILKTMEGTGETLFTLMKEYVSQSLFTKIGGLMLKPALKRLAMRVDYEEYGGSPLLGVNGNCVICHGRSRSKAITNAVEMAARIVSRRVLEEIKIEFS